MEQNDEIKKTDEKAIDPSAHRKKELPIGLSVFAWCLIGSIAMKGWKEFFVGLGVMPIGTLAELLGLAILPFLLGWVIARLLSLAIKKISFRNLWIIGSTVIIVIAMIGQWRSATGY